MVRLEPLSIWTGRGWFQTAVLFQTRVRELSAAWTSSPDAAA
jgi:hypothetical protein